MINLYIIDYENPLQNNGLSTYVYELIESIKLHEDINIHCVWLNSKKQEVFKENIGGIENIYIPKNIVGSTFSQLNTAITNVIVEDMERKENVLVHINWINHCNLIWLIKQRINCSAILTKHCIPWRDFVTTNFDLFYEIDQALKHKEPIRSKHKFLRKELLGYEHLDHIITVTQFAKQSLERIFEIPSKKISVINNGISPKEEVELSAYDLRKKYGFEADEKIILFAGKVNVRKGVIDLIKAFELLLKSNDFQNTRLVIAGEGDHSHVIKHCKRWWSKITFTGNIDKKTLKEFYKMANVGVIPSYVEQCSYTAIEMMYDELPIVVSDVDGLSEIVPENCGLKVRVNFDETVGVSLDIRSLKAKLAFMLQNPSGAKIFAKNAKENTLKNFTSEKMVGETLNVYNRVINNKKAVAINQRKGKEKNIHLKKHYPLVSIVLPCYNAEKYLKECLSSILQQTYENFELIIIDDGSTDETNKIIEKFNDSRIVHEQNLVNNGIVYSLNKGIKLAKGQYIARMDADDVMIDSRLEYQVSFLNTNSDYGVVGSNYKIIDSTGLPIDYVQLPANNEELKLTLLFHNSLIHPTIMMRTKIAVKYLYDEKFKYCEDYDMWLKISKEVKVANLHDNLLCYRIHSENTTAEDQKTLRENLATLYSRELDNLGVSYNSRELMLHMAIGLRQGSLFNEQEKIAELNRWLEKVLFCESLKRRYKNKRLNEFKYHILNRLSLVSD